mmetsp:Transcript_32831/g.77467  ORF Transcript_32831/g.77467 Transcript_32831/m.77467 type:complete len:200 (-) Transcript_32831:595-1194(-)
MGNVVAAVASVPVRDLGPLDERVADLAGDPKALRVDCQDRQRVGSLYLEGQIDAVPGGRLVDLSQRGAGDGFRRQVLKQGLLLLGAVVIVIVIVIVVVVVAVVVLGAFILVVLGVFIVVECSVCSFTSKGTVTHAGDQASRKDHSNDCHRDCICKGWLWKRLIIANHINKFEVFIIVRRFWINATPGSRIHVTASIHVV